MNDTITLSQAGDQLGISGGALKRLIRTGKLPEARKVNGVGGSVWVIPEEKLATIAKREGLVIDLRDESSTTESPTTESPATESPATETSTTESSTTETAGADSDQPETSEADEAAAGSAIVPHQANTPEASGDAAPTIAEVVDMRLLDRLLGVQEEKINAVHEARNSKNALAALADDHRVTASQLEEERRERLLNSDRFREERMARILADAKVAELRDRVVREMALADAEKEARAEATMRGIRAERDATNAVASLGWLARRRYRRLSAKPEA